MQWTYSLSYTGNIMFTTLLQQILNSRLLLTVIDWQKINFSSGFKLKLIITYHLRYIEKAL